MSARGVALCLKKNLKLSGFKFEVISFWLLVFRRRKLTLVSTCKLTLVSSEFKSRQNARKTVTLSRSQITLFSIPYRNFMIRTAFRNCGIKFNNQKYGKTRNYHICSVAVVATLTSLMICLSSLRTYGCTY